MKALTFAALASFCLASLNAQELATELAPAAAKYKADLAAVETQKTAATARIQQQYFIALDAAEKTATTTGSVDTVAAITREREAAKSGLMPPAIPADLPKTLQMPRKTYLDGLARINTDLAPRQKAAEADYLRALAALQPKAAANPELAKQIAAEKEKLVASSAGPGTVKAGGKSAIINGSFDQADAEGRPTGWRFPDRGNISYKIVREGASSFTRVTVDGSPVDGMAYQLVPVPPHAKTMMLRGKIRGKWTERDTKDSNFGANVSARFAGADEQLIGPWVINVGGRDTGGWKTLSKSIPVESGAKTLRVQYGPQWVAGTFDFDDVEVEFR